VDSYCDEDGVCDCECPREYDTTFFGWWKWINDINDELYHECKEDCRD
jgi:hypothetical protein